MKIPLGSGYKVSVHDQGTLYVIIAGAVTLLSALTLGVGGLTVFLAVLTAAVISFFRDPERVVPKGQNLIVSPGDGKIVDISVTEVPSELLHVQEKEMQKISIFLSVFDVHVNRVPIAGKVVETNYYPGKFLNASLDKASKDNERNTIVLQSENGQNVVCVQIAGLIARRIISDAEEGTFYPLGDRYGIIKFGSRLDVYAPKSAKINVAVGQTVIGGESILGQLQE